MLYKRRSLLGLSHSSGAEEIVVCRGLYAACLARRDDNFTNSLASKVFVKSHLAREMRVATLRNLYDLNFP